jgi:sugar phosphate isomerase/epimerase
MGSWGFVKWAGCIDRVPVDGDCMGKRETSMRRKMIYPFTEDMLNLLGRVHVNMPWKQVEHHLEKILRFRMNVELGFEAKELDRVPRNELHALADRLHKAGCRITMHGPFWDLSPGSVDPLVRRVSRRRLQQFFELLEIFHPLQVVCHTGFDPRHHRGHRRIWVEESLLAWEPLVKRAEALNVPLLLENVWEYDPELHLELFGRIPSSHFGFCLDVGHQHSFSKTSLLLWVETLIEHLKEIHIHDNDGSGDAHLPVGEGTIDFYMLFNYLRRNGKEPLLTLEPHVEEHLARSLEGLCRVMNGG